MLHPAQNLITVKNDANVLLFPANMLLLIWGFLCCHNILYIDAGRGIAIGAARAPKERFR